MKTIIAPVDFSEASINALLFASELSKRTSARLIIINILGEAEVEAQVKDQLKSTEAMLRGQFGSEMKCESVIVHGNFTTFERTTADLQPDLIVMGTKGASGLKKILIGSNTVTAIANTRVPIFVIPEVALFENFLNAGKSRIVLATDLDELENENALDILKEIARVIINPKIRVLSVRPKGTELSFNKRMEREAILSRFKPEIESERVTVFSSNVLSGINFYLNKNPDTGLVAMIARESGHLIQRHYTHEMASHTHLPLLVMHAG